MANTLQKDSMFPGQEKVLPGKEQNLVWANRKPLFKTTNTNPEPRLGSMALPQDSFTSYIVSGPFKLGQILMDGRLGDINAGILLGTFVNVSVLGYVLNIVAKRPNPMDSFGPIVVGTGQILSGVVIRKPFAAVVPTKE